VEERAGRKQKAVEALTALELYELGRDRKASKGKPWRNRST